MRSRLCAAVAALLALGVLSGTAFADRTVAPAAPAAASKTAVLVARYNFDGQGGMMADDSGHGRTLHLVARGGGKVRTVPHGSGQAVQFPTGCTGAKCPHAVLQTPHATELNPGKRPLLFGATIKLPRKETTKGQNVVQKGYSKKGSQFKLQIDGVLGRPSCALVDVAKRGIRLVRSAVSVADGQWHAIQCRRVGTTFTVIIDGTVRGVATIPAALSVSNNRPLSIGGKGAYRDNDQFQGALDDVWVQIG